MQTSFELPMNAALSMAHSSEVFRLEEGEVDIFAVDIDGEGRQGLRHHLFSIVAPALVLGMGLNRAGPLDVVAQSRGARLRAGAEFDVGEVDRWIEYLSEALHRRLTEQGVQGLAPRLGEAGALSPGRIAVASRPSAEMLGLPDARASLDRFHAAWAAALFQAIEARRLEEAERLERRGVVVGAAMDRTLAGFVRLVSDRDGGVRSDVHFDEPLLQACALVAEAVGCGAGGLAKSQRRRGNASSLTVEAAARAARLRVRQVALRGAWWEQDLGPMVACLEPDQRPVALLPENGSAYRLVDPANGGRALVVDADLGMALHPMAWTFYAPLPDGRLSFGSVFWQSLLRRKRDVALVLLVGVLGSVLAIAIPVATAAVFQDIIPGHDTGALLQVGLALVVVTLTQIIFKISGDVALLRIEGHIAVEILAGVIDRLLRLPSSFFSLHSTADLADRVLAVDSMRRTMSRILLSAGMAGFSAISSLVLLAFYHPQIALLALALGAVTMGGSVYVGLKELPLLSRMSAQSAAVTSLVLQLIMGVRALRVAGAESRAWINWGRAFVNWRETVVKQRLISNLYETVMAGWDIISLALVFLIAAIAAGDRLETGQFIAIVAAFTLFTVSVSKLSHAVVTGFTIAPMIERLAPLLKAEPEVSQDQVDPGVLAGDIEVNNVVFRYQPDAPLVLDGLSLRVRPGQFVALVGPSGCGKSTLMRLLLGFEQPEAGGVYYDGRDLRGLDIQAVRRQIGVVLQSGRIMPGSIYENIKGATAATIDEAWDAARAAGFEADVRAMPMGLHTLLTEGSGGLSGGQVQRLLIARAIVAKPRVILLDEATSALDNRTQAIVTESLNRASVTRIAIAHRLSTVKEADMIYVLDHGQIAECGSYDELIVRNGLFATLARRQMIEGQD
jgi:NHLM bacteriocin system ABC transporter ATP-binding protein